MTDDASSAAGSVSRTTTVRNRYGVHARPAGLIVKTATAFTLTDITIMKTGNPPVSAKSIMGLLTIEGHKGAVMTIAARGPEAEQAVNAIQELFDHNFYED